jgi:heat shock protein HslJ
VRRLVLVLSIVALVSTACGEASDTRTNPVGQWEFVSGTGPDGAIENVEGYRTTFAIEDDGARGIVGCNAFGTDSVRITGTRIVFGEFSGTLVDCEKDVASFEERYGRALMRVSKAKRSGDRLVLSGSSGELVYTEIEPVRLDEVIDRIWTLKAFTDTEGDHDAVGDATLRFGESGALEGTTGCRPLRMRYVVEACDGVQPALDGMPSSALDECSDLAEQEAVIGQIFGAMGRHMEVDGNRLTLSGQGGYELVYETD